MMSDSTQTSDSRADKAIKRKHYVIQCENLERKTIAIAKGLTSVHQRISISRRWGNSRPRVYLLL
jgi:hypothetical protein